MREADKDRNALTAIDVIADEEIDSPHEAREGIAEHGVIVRE